MPLTPTQLQALKAELNTDPRSYGYAADIASGYIGGLVSRLNLARDGTNGGPLIKLAVPTADTGVIRANISKAAYDGLTTGDRTWLNWFTSAGSVTVTADTIQMLAGVPTASGSVWSAATRTAMNAAMDAVLRYTGSRSQELFVVQVTNDDVANALRS